MNIAFRPGWRCSEKSKLYCKRYEAIMGSGSRVDSHCYLTAAPLYTVHSNLVCRKEIRYKTENSKTQQSLLAIVHTCARNSYIFVDSFVACAPQECVLWMRKEALSGSKVTWNRLPTVRKLACKKPICDDRQAWKSRNICYNIPYILFSFIRGEQFIEDVCVKDDAKWEKLFKQFVTQ